MLEIFNDKVKRQSGNIANKLKKSSSHCKYFSYFYRLRSVIRVGGQDFHGKCSSPCSPQIQLGREHCKLPTVGSGLKPQPPTVLVLPEGSRMTSNVT